MSNFFADYLASWATLDLETVMAFFTDDIVYRDMTIGHGASGIDEMRRFTRHSFKNMPDASFDYIRHVTDGTTYAMEWVMQPMNIPGVSFGVMRDGKICENRDYWNGAAFKVPNT